MSQSNSVTFQGEERLFPRLFDKSMSLFLLSITLPLLFLPKINLWQIRGQTAGLRIDDVLLLGFAVFYFWGMFSLRKKILSIELALASIVGFSILSFILNRLFVITDYLHVEASLFYSFRLLEYFLFFYVGMLAARFISLQTIIRALFLWNLFFMALQGMGLLGVFSTEGYVFHTGDRRLLGIASFGAEIGLLLNMFFCYFLYEKPAFRFRILLLPRKILQRIQKYRPYWLLLPFSVLVIYTGARIAIAAMITMFVIRSYQLLRWRSLKTIFLPIMCLALAGALTYYLLSYQSGIAARSEGLASGSNLELIPLVWENVTLDYDPIGKETIDYDNYDVSWWMRIHKWCYALKIYILHPACWLQGVGPGFAMAALDGGWLRILTELGIIGSALYVILAIQIAKLSDMLKWMMVALGLNMIFFDVYLAYKPMILLFLMAGYACSNQKENISPSL